MEKINFVNYEQPALNATNLNQLQDNVEDAIDEKITTALTPVSYSLTNLPEHSAGTNTIYVHKIGNIVVMNIGIWINSITANTWVNIATIPADIRPQTTNILGMCSYSSGSTGNMVGQGFIELNGNNLRVKVNTASNSLVCIKANVVYVL